MNDLKSENLEIYIAAIRETGKASKPFLREKFSIGHGRADKIMRELERRKIVSKAGKTGLRTPARSDVSVLEKFFVAARSPLVWFNKAVMEAPMEEWSKKALDAFLRETEWLSVARNNAAKLQASRPAAPTSTASPAAPPAAAPSGSATLSASAGPPAPAPTSSKNPPPVKCGPP